MKEFILLVGWINFWANKGYTNVNFSIASSPFAEELRVRKPQIYWTETITQAFGLLSPTYAVVGAEYFIHSLASTVVKPELKPQTQLEG